MESYFAKLNYKRMLYHRGTVQLCSGDFVVCNGDNTEQTSHRVCRVNSYGDVVDSYEGLGSLATNTPSHNGR